MIVGCWAAAVWGNVVSSVSAHLRSSLSSLSLISSISSIDVVTAEVVSRLELPVGGYSRQMSWSLPLSCQLFLRPLPPLSLLPLAPLPLPLFFLSSSSSLSSFSSFFSCILKACRGGNSTLNYSTSTASYWLESLRRKD
jgi:hypothetical protein